MAKIFCLIGETCSGKDTIFKKLLEKDKTLTPIVTYTTRPMRETEKNGREYYFVDRKVFNKLKYNNKIIEYRSYKTVHGSWLYFVVNDGQIDINSDKKYIVISTLEGAKKLKDIYKNDVFIFHIWVNDETRILRAFAREMNTNQDYIEMCRRFVSDNKDFSQERFVELGIADNKIINDSIPNCVESLLKLLK